MNHIPPQLADNSPADKLVYRTVTDLGPVTKQDVVEATALSQSTVYRSIERLIESDLVERSESPDDLRQSCYQSASHRG